MLPDLVLILAVCFSLHNGSLRGSFYGITFGLVEDFYAGRMIGLNALCLGIIGYLAGKLHPSVYRERVLIGVAGVVAATALSGLLRTLSFYFFYNSFAYQRLTEIPLQMLYNAVLTFPIYLWYYHSSHYGFLQKPAEDSNE